MSLIKNDLIIEIEMNRQFRVAAGFMFRVVAWFCTLVTQLFTFLTCVEKAVNGGSDFT